MKVASAGLVVSPANTFSTLLLLDDSISRVQGKLDVPLSVHAHRLVKVHRLQREQLWLPVGTYAVELTTFHPVITSQKRAAALEDDYGGGRCRC